MANFFGKPKGSMASTSCSRSNSLPKDSFERGQSETKEEINRPSDFERIFKPFLLKKDAELAPTNWFNEVRAGKKKRTSDIEGEKVIVIEDDELRPDMHMGRSEEDVQMLDVSHPSNELNRGQMTAEGTLTHLQVAQIRYTDRSPDRLRDSLSTLPPSLRPPILSYPPRRHRMLKSRHPYNVRGIMQDLNEAEVAGDEAAVRDLLSRLRDRASTPAKVLIFHQDARPGYFGTWTRNSREVGPRTPFARDVVSLDYGVDSGEEWEEEEEEGEVVDGDEDEEGAATEEVDSDLDDWLVDDDDVEDPGTPIDDRPGSPDFFPPLPPPPPKRKAKEAEADGDASKKDTKKRKVVIPLVPFVKGPCWQSHVGECTYEPFNAYRIHIFNGESRAQMTANEHCTDATSDTAFPIDPFKFVSTLESDTIPSKPQTTQPSSGFAVPSLPARLSNGSLASNAHLQPGTSAQPKRPLPPPKTSFPDVHMPFLISKITELDTGNLTFIVESVYKELKGLPKTMGVPVVKKNAIEAKVKEVGEKDKKVWTVKSEIKVRGVTCVIEVKLTL